MNDPSITIATKTTTTNLPGPSQNQLEMEQQQQQQGKKILNDLCDICHKNPYVNELNRQCVYKQCPTRNPCIPIINSNDNSDDKTTITKRPLKSCQQCHNPSKCLSCNLTLCRHCRTELHSLQCSLCHNFICSKVCYDSILDSFRRPSNNPNEVDDVEVEEEGGDDDDDDENGEVDKLINREKGDDDDDDIHNKEEEKEEEDHENDQDKKKEKEEEKGKQKLFEEKNHHRPLVPIRLFFSCGQCKRQTCGCEDWSLNQCFECRLYYCNVCSTQRLQRCELEECSFQSCCDPRNWKKNCVPCNRSGNCQLVFCTRGHCNTHVIEVLPKKQTTMTIINTKLNDVDIDDKRNSDNDVEMLDV